MANILNVKEGINIVPNIIDAIANGYRDDMILDELAQAVETKIITRGQFEQAVDALDLYAARFTSSVKSIAESMKKFEFNDEQPILKDHRIDLAQQVMQDVDGFNNAVDEYSDEEGDEQVLDEQVPEKVVKEETEETEEETEVEKIDDKESANIATAEKKPSYKEYFMKKLDKFGIVNPRDLSPEQWENIDSEWSAKKESD